MRNFTRFKVNTSCVFVMLSVSSCSSQVRESKDDKYQHNYLDSCFSVIKRNIKKVRVSVRPYKNLSLGAGNRDLQVGSQFYMFEKDYGYKYYVKAIKINGIKISYKGHNYGESKEVLGDVTLKWKP